MSKTDEGIFLKNSIFRTTLRFISFTRGKIYRPPLPLKAFWPRKRLGDFTFFHLVSVLYNLLTNTNCTHQYFSVHFQVNEVQLQSTIIKFRAEHFGKKVCKGQQFYSKFQCQPPVIYWEIAHYDFKLQSHVQWLLLSRCSTFYQAALHMAVNWFCNLNEIEITHTSLFQRGLSFLRLSTKLLLLASSLAFILTRTQPWIYNARLS